MKITVIGTGYVGLVAGLCFSDFGHEVICLDIDGNKIKMLKEGKCPIYEPGAELLLQKNTNAGRIRFTTNSKEAVEFGELIFIGVGTPQSSTGEADLSYVFSAAKDIGKHINKYKVIIDKSTVPIGTAHRVKEIIRQEIIERKVEIDFDVASNPEFLREGKAINDFTNPDRIVIGVDSEKAETLLKKAYSSFTRSNKPLIVTSIVTAEMIKYASNAFLATKITFINEIANLCEAVGADVLEVAAAMGKDGRISPKFLHPGPGYGGSCFPKDTIAITSIARENNVKLDIVESVIRANQHQKELAARKILKRFPKGATIALLGLAFKPETDDVREAPALEIIKILSAEGNYIFQVYDPQAMQGVKERELHGMDNISYCIDAYEACKNADCMAVVTEWYEFRNMDFEKLKDLLKNPIIFDFRNIYRRKDAEDMGFEYFGTGV